MIQSRQAGRKNLLAAHLHAFYMICFIEMV